MSIERSPKFPAIPLQDGLSTIEKLFKNAGRTALDPLGVVKAIGYAGLSGASRSMLGALSGYGLLAKEGGGKYRVSDDALHAVKPLNDQERLQYVRKLALHPPLFSELFRTSKECSESVLATTLLHKNFTEDGAKRAAKIFKDNFEFARLGEEGVESIDETQPPVNAAPLTQMIAPAAPIPAKGSISALIEGSTLPVPVGDRIAVIPFPVAEEDFDLLIKTLNLWKSKIVKKPLAEPLES